MVLLDIGYRLVADIRRDRRPDVFLIIILVHIVTDHGNLIADLLGIILGDLKPPVRQIRHDIVRRCLCLVQIQPRIVLKLADLGVSENIRAETLQRRARIRKLVFPGRIDVNTEVVVNLVPVFLQMGQHLVKHLGENLIFALIAVVGAAVFNRHGKSELVVRQKLAVPVIDTAAGCLDVLRLFDKEIVIALIILPTNDLQDKQPQDQYAGKHDHHSHQRRHTRTQYRFSEPFSEISQALCFLPVSLPAAPQQIPIGDACAAPIESYSNLICSRPDRSTCRSDGEGNRKTMLPPSYRPPPVSSHSSHKNPCRCAPAAETSLRI